MIWYQTFKCLSTTFLSFLSSRATRIRTLKWRSQSPLPYHLAIALYKAQGVGFEPTRPCGQTVFKTASLWPLRYPCTRAGDGNRTHVSSLEGWCSTIELHPHVYIWSRAAILINGVLRNAQNRNRTSDTRIFSPLLYQLSYLGIDYKSLSCGSRIWTCDLRVMSPTSFQTAPSRDIS